MVIFCIFMKQLKQYKMNTYNFLPTLFDARFNGVYSFETVLAYHKTIADNMPIDGLIWLCENPKIETLHKRKDELVLNIRTLEEGQKNQPYGVWTILDREAHKMRTRLQLVRLCIDKIQNK